MGARKLLVFGIDGGTFDVILPMAKAGRLPHLQRVLAEGFHADLNSTIHPITAPAWTSFATGCNPGKHGIFDFQSHSLKGYGFRLNSARERGVVPFWTLLQRAGLKSIVVNVPFTYPPDSLDGGIVIAGFETPDATRAMATPPEVFDELVAAFGSYTPDWTFPVGRFHADRYWQDVVDAIERRTTTSLHLMTKHPWDVFVVVYGSIDHLQHIYYGLGAEGRALIERAYEQVDAALGRLLQAAGQDTDLMIVSDHGFGEIRKVVYLDRWLEREGFLAYRSPWSLRHIGRWLAGTARYVVKGLLPRGVRRYVRRSMPEVRDFMVTHSGGPEVEWSRTQAYSGGMYGNIYVNSVGLRPFGVVGADEYDAVCDRIAKRLLALTDPDTGEHIVERVHRRKDLYAGAFVERAPDLIVQWKDYAYFTKKGIDRKGSILGKHLTLDASDCPHTGTHRVAGILLARGPGFARGQKGSPTSIMDVAPSLLYHWGLPIPRYMDGGVVREMFDATLWDSRAPEYTDEVSGADAGPGAGGPGSGDSDQKALEQRLRSLGYI